MASQQLKWSFPGREKVLRLLKSKSVTRGTHYRKCVLKSALTLNVFQRLNERKSQDSKDNNYLFKSIKEY